MPKSPDIFIDVHYQDALPIVAVLEANLDPERVIVRRHPLAVKAFIPINFAIEATSLFLFEELVLKPLLSPAIERLDWTKQIAKMLHEMPPVNITVNINNAEFIDANLETAHEITANIWEIITRVLQILRADGRLEMVEKIRIASGQDGKFYIVCYLDGRPALIVDLKSERVTAIRRQ